MSADVGVGGHAGKSAIITVTYNKIPVLANFERAVEIVDYVIICDNSSDSSVIDYLERYCKANPKFVLLKNNENLGISKAYNKAVAFARKLGVFWLYFFDDDANFDVEWIGSAKDSWLELEAGGVPVGILAPIISNNPEYLHSNVGFRSRFSVISSVITSGVFTNTDVFSRSGGSNPDFFVDWADLELARRVKESGFLVVRLNEVFVFQAFGHNLRNTSLRNRLINAYIKSSSLFSLRLNKSNTLSTFYSVYSINRYSNQKTNALWSMKHSGIRNLGFRLL
jgi:GT2 family glycosyltransferase